MTRQSIHEICAVQPGATLDHKFGLEHDSWKVGGKLFAICGANDGVSVKTDSIDTARMLIEAGVAVRARYCHASWATVPVTADPAELVHRVTGSYTIVTSSLTRKAQAALPAISPG